jgi:hypothetical protein
MKERKAYRLGTINCFGVRRFLHQNGFRYSDSLPEALENVMMAVLVAAMRNARTLDKNNNRRVTVRGGDVPPVDALEIALGKREKRLKRKVERLEERLQKYENQGEFLE